MIGTLVVLDHSRVRRWNNRSFVWSNLFLAPISYPWSHFKRTGGTIKTYVAPGNLGAHSKSSFVHPQWRFTSGDELVFLAQLVQLWLSTSTFTNLGVTQRCLCVLCTSYGQTLHEVNTLYSGWKFKVLPECLLANIPVKAANHNKKQGSFCSVLLQQTWSVWKDDREGKKNP